LFTNGSVVKVIVSLALGVSLGASSGAHAQQAGQSSQQTAQQSRPPDPARTGPALAAQYKAPDNIDFRTASIMSEGVRLHAELFSLKSLAGKPLPTIIQAHGWGGTASGFRRDSLDFANAGYLVINFDYRGWGKRRAPRPHQAHAGQTGFRAESKVHGGSD